VTGSMWRPTPHHAPLAAQQETKLPAIYDVYGLCEPVLGEAAGQLAEILGVVWQENNS
jgi:hypothetical protein